MTNKFDALKCDELGRVYSALYEQRVARSLGGELIAADECEALMREVSRARNWVADQP